jgi:thiamine biosynthesis lipoprotein
MNLQVLRQEQNHMATIFDFRISCEPSLAAAADRVLRECHLEVTKLENELSEFLPESPVFQLNHSTSGTRVRFSQAAFELLECAERLKELSAGAFDPLAKSTEVASRIGYDKKTLEVWKETPGAWLGFGAIGKGFALDRVAARIQAAGFSHSLLSAGGSSLVFSGWETPSTPWHWGWSWKRNESGENLGIPFTHSTGEKIALGISGTHEKGEHILKSADSRASAVDLNIHKMKSSLIATQSAAVADAMSTALFVAGWENSTAFLNRLPLPPAAACIDHEEVPHWNGLFQRLWNGIGTATASLLLAITFGLSGLTKAHADETIDLSSLGDSAKSFTPYVFERNSLWVLLPIFCFLVVLVHLRKTKPKRDRQKLAGKLMKKNLTSTLSSLAVISLVWLNIESARAVVIEPLGKAVGTILGTTKAQQKTLKGTDGENVTVLYSKENHRAAFVQKGLYKPDCTHTWAVGIDMSTGAVTEVRVVEMACPHAYPTKSASFLDQFKGKGPADVATLDSDIHTIAKATGTSVLATDAVKRSINEFTQYKSQF